MRCPKCDTQLRRRSRFCPECGEKLPEERGSNNPFRRGPRTADDDASTEQGLWSGSFSPLAMIGEWIMAAAVSLGSIIFGWVGRPPEGSWLAIIGLNAALWAALILRYLYVRLSRYYVLTNQRFTHRRGLLWQQTDRIETIDIDDVSYTQNPVERIFGTGTVRITSSDQSHPELSLSGIDNVKDVAMIIDDARRQERRRRGLYIESV